MEKYLVTLIKNNAYPVSRQSLEIGSGFGHDLTLANGKLAASKRPMHTNDMGPCLAILLQSPNQKFMAHIAPEIEISNTVITRLNKVISEMRNSFKRSYEELIAVITGGIEYNSKSNLSAKSMELAETAYDVFSKEGIPTTIIAGQRGDGLNTRLNLYSHYKNSFIWGKPINSINPKNASQKEVQRALEDNFDFVEIAPEIPVTITNKLPGQINKSLKTKLS